MEWERRKRDGWRYKVVGSADEERTLHPPGKKVLDPT